MDSNEVAERLARIREAIRDELDLEGISLDDGAPESSPFELKPGVGLILHGEPGLTSTPHLEEANRAAGLSAPVSLRSGKPVVGPLLTLLRKLFRPVVQAFVDPYVDRQEAFNSHVVRHLNDLGTRLERRVRGIEEALIDWSANPGGIDARLRRTLEDHDAALRQRMGVLFAALEDQLSALENLGRDALRRRTEEIQELHALLENLSDQVGARVAAVDQRFDEKDRALEQLGADVGSRYRVLQDWIGQAAAQLRRREGEIVRLEESTAELLALRSRLALALEGMGDGEVAAGRGAAGNGGGGGNGSEAPGDAAAVSPGVGASSGTDASSDPALAAWADVHEWMRDQDYRVFQASFRGDEDDIRRRMEAHVARFEGAPGPVADLGCGRGEFLDLLRDAGQECVGVEINAADVEECRSRGHEAVTADLFDWLDERAEGSLGGIFAAQVIEHLPPRQWQRLVELAVSRLAPGGRLVLETINPESLYAIVRAYVLDPTHVRPVHPELLAFLARRAGFDPVQVQLQAPVPDELRAADLPLEIFRGQGPVEQLARLVKERLDRLDRITCGPQEYTLEARRPGVAVGRRTAGEEAAGTGSGQGGGDAAAAGSRGGGEASDTGTHEPGGEPSGTGTHEPGGDPSDPGTRDPGADTVAGTGGSGGG